MSRRPIFALVLGFAAVSGCNCGAGTHVVHVPEQYKVVPGSPGVNPDQPTIDDPPPPPPISYKINVPRQCDVFTQNTVRKVDILWVIQNSGSMASHQAQLAANFASFIQFLLTADPPIDFHIGVTTTDTDDTNVAHPAQGRLSGWSNADASGGFIACDSNHTCNTQPSGGDASVSVEAAFSQMSSVGIYGSSHQRGLYASYLALNDPANIDTGSGQGFVRQDAALFVVYVGSEDDLSCAPTVNQPAPGDACRTVDSECHCQDDTSLAWGTTGFYERFLENYKGYGHSDLVAAAAVVATAQDPVPQQFLLQYGNPYPGIGCTGQDSQTGGTLAAFYGKRYIEVAQATGGSSTSICAENFNDALARLGFAVSGLRRDFKLSRGPSTNTLSVYVAKRNAASCTTDNECATDPDGYNACQAGHCSKAVPIGLQPNDNGSQYIQCQDTVLRNVVEFGSNPAVIPPAQGTVEICYDVDAHFNASCQ